MEAKEQGNKAFQQGNWQEAVDWYTKALESDTRLVAAYANRAASEINLHQWDQGLADCNAALALDSPASLRIKVLWRKAVCLRHIGQSESEWLETVRQGLILDSANDKLQEEQKRLFVRRTQSMPSEYSSVKTTAPAPAPHQQATRAILFTPPPRPLSYAGVLKLTRSKSEAAYDYWYAEVPAEELIQAHRSAGIEPDTLDYIHEMIALHPQNTDRNKEFLQALPQCARYSSASLLADEILYKKALDSVGGPK